jgi:hypothetical protein
MPVDEFGCYFVENYFFILNIKIYIGICFVHIKFVFKSSLPKLWYATDKGVCSHNIYIKFIG